MGAAPACAGAPPLKSLPKKPGLFPPAEAARGSAATRLAFPRAPCAPRCGAWRTCTTGRGGGGGGGGGGGVWRVELGYDLTTHIGDRADMLGLQPTPTCTAYTMQLTSAIVWTRYLLHPPRQRWAGCATRLCTERCSQVRPSRGALCGLPRPSQTRSLAQGPPAQQPNTSGRKHTKVQNGCAPQNPNKSSPTRFSVTYARLRAVRARAHRCVQDGMALPLATLASSHRRSPLPLHHRRSRAPSPPAIACL
jgi:hypothetical protein